MEMGLSVVPKFIINVRPVPNIHRFDVKHWRSEIRYSGDDQLIDNSSGDPGIIIIHNVIPEFVLL